MLRLAMLLVVFHATLEIQHAVHPEDSLTVRLRLAVLAILLVRLVTDQRTTTV